MNCKKVDEDHSQWDTLARVITHNTKGRFAPPARAKPTGKAGGRKAAKPKPKPVLGKDGLPLSKEKQELALLMKRCDDTIKAKLKKGRGIGYVALGEQRVFLMPVRYMPICEINEVNGTNVSNV